MKIFKLLWISLVLIINGFNVFSQPSFETFFAFRLFDENNQVVDAHEFTENYELKNVFADTLTLCQSIYKWECPLYYDSSSTYFLHRIGTIGWLFCFAIYHDDKIMAIFLPAETYASLYYAIDSLHFKEGNYLFDFPESKDTVRFFGMNYQRVEKIDWEERRKAFLKSDYVGSETRYYKE